MLGCLVFGWLPIDFLEFEPLLLSDRFRLEDLPLLASRVGRGETLAAMGLSPNLRPTVFRLFSIGLGDVEVMLLLLFEL